MPALSRTAPSTLSLSPPDIPSGWLATFFPLSMIFSIRSCFSSYFSTSSPTLGGMFSLADCSPSSSSSPFFSFQTFLVASRNRLATSFFVICVFRSNFSLINFGPFWYSSESLSSSSCFKAINSFIISVNLNLSSFAKSSMSVLNLSAILLSFASRFLSSVRAISSSGLSSCPNQSERSEAFILFSAFCFIVALSVI